MRSQFDEVNERLRADLDLISSGATAGDGFASPAVVSAHSQGNSPRAGAGDAVVSSRFAANRDGDSRRRAIRRRRDRDSALYRYVVTLTFTRVNFTRRENRARDARAAWIRSRRRETRETSVTV